MFYVKDQLSAIEKWISYLEDLFHVKVSALDLFFDNFEKEEDINRIMDYYCSESSEHKLEEFHLDNGGYTKDSALYNERPVSILKRQNASETLTIAFDPSPSFNFDFELLKAYPNRLHVYDSRWIRWEQVLDMKSSSVFLLKSNFLSSQIESLVQKWKSGWTPGWETLQIDLCETFDVFRCVPEGSMDIEFGDYPNVASLLRHDSVQSFKFQHIDETTTKSTDGFHLVRSDKMVITVTREHSGHCFFQILPEDPEYEFLI